MMRYAHPVRTTVTLSDDVAAAVERIRKERTIGVSEAVNELVRAGLAQPETAHAFEQRTHELGVGLDVSNIGDVLETLDGLSAR